MDIKLSDKEVELLSEMVEKDIHELLREIANADSRKFREDLKAKEEILLGVQKKLSAATGR